MNATSLIQWGTKEDTPFDSDDDFRSPEGFMKDKLIGGLPLADMAELLAYVERFIAFSK